jgi:hypothetical protein
MVGLLFFLLRLLLSPTRGSECRASTSTDGASMPGARSDPVHEQRSHVFPPIDRWFPSIVEAMTTVRPETLVRWHRAGFRRYWRWKSRNLGGRSPIDAGLRALIRQMSIENMLWGAPRIQGELLRLGFTVARSTVAKYMAKRCGPSGQTWGTFLRNHAPHIAAMDLFVVPSISFVQLHVLVIVRLARRELVWINVTSHLTAEWIAGQRNKSPPSPTY